MRRCFVRAAPSVFRECLNSTHMKGHFSTPKCLSDRHFLLWNPMADEIELFGNGRVECLPHTEDIVVFVTSASGKH